MDLRTSPDVIKSLAAQAPPKAPVTTAEGEALAKTLGFARYLECSSLTQEGLKLVFDAAIQAALESKEKLPEVEKKKKCVII